MGVDKFRRGLERLRDDVLFLLYLVDRVCGVVRRLDRLLTSVGRAGLDFRCCRRRCLRVVLVGLRVVRGVWV